MTMVFACKSIAFMFTIWLATTPVVCVANRLVEHPFSCPCGGLPTIRHNVLQDITAQLLTKTLYAIMYKLNHLRKVCQVNHFSIGQLILGMNHNLMSLRMASGNGDRMHIVM